MAYSAEISRTNPTCFLFVIDQSASMSDPFGGSPDIQKAQFVSDALNRTLQNLVIGSSKSEGIRDYFWIGAIGYGAEIGPALSGALADKDLVSISEVANNPARVEERTRKVSDGTGGVIDVPVKFPIWFDPKANGGTPMVNALTRATSILSKWVSDHPQSFPPVVLHLTDGESTDGDPSIQMNEIRSLSTEDGDALLLNLHVSSVKAEPVQFPGPEATLPNDRYARLLFDNSSPLVPHMMNTARDLGVPVTEGSRGFVFNGQIQDVVDFLEIGTRAANLR